MNPQDANPAGNVHGGVIMKLIDTAAGAAAMKHSRSNCVTASVDRLDFHNPVFIGDLVTLRAGLNYTGKSSMEVGVRVESQNLLTGEIRHTVSAYMTFVALDKNGKPIAMPPLILETPEEQRRNRGGTGPPRGEAPGEDKGESVPARRRELRLTCGHWSATKQSRT